MEYSWDMNELLMDLFGLAMSQPSFFLKKDHHHHHHHHHHLIW